jgi:hypothetical protein
MIIIVKPLILIIMITFITIMILIILIGIIVISNYTVKRILENIDNEITKIMIQELSMTINIFMVILIILTFVMYLLYYILR